MLDTVVVFNGSYLAEHAKYHDISVMNHLTGQMSLLLIEKAYHMMRTAPVSRKFFKRQMTEYVGRFTAGPAYSSQIHGHKSELTPLQIDVQSRYGFIPDLKDPEYSPDDRQLNALYTKITSEFKNGRNDQQILCDFLEDYRRTHPDDFVFIRYGKDATETEPEVGFMWIFIAREQMRLMKLQGSGLQFDATFKCTLLDYYTHFVTLKTNQGKVLCVASAITKREDEATLTEVFQRIKDAVDGYEPRVVFTDECDAQIAALENVYPNSRLLICWVHQDRSWNKTIPPKCRNKKQGEAALKALKDLRFCYSESEFDEKYKKMQRRAYWKKVKTYVQNTINRKDRWAWYGRKKLFTKNVMTTNIAESHNQLCSLSVFRNTCFQKHSFFRNTRF